MIARFALPLALLFAHPATALELDNLTAQERVQFRAEVRAYLLDNPEVLQEAIAILQQREQNAQLTADLELARANADALQNDGYSFVDGNPEGDITVVEFMDYRCGYCKRAFPEVAQLLADDPNIRFVVKELPILGEQSVLASRFAIATQIVGGDDAYKAVHDTLMEFRGDISEQSLTRLGSTLGIDTDAVLAQMDSPVVSEIIAANSVLAQQLNISGTPTFVFEDQIVRGYLQLAQMEQLVEELRAQ
ncbi:DsbA family protein [Yoonia sediminilitoris]|nr:DsbA family protein [Yoonia sediminilitoris]